MVSIQDGAVRVLLTQRYKMSVKGSCNLMPLKESHSVQIIVLVGLNTCAFMRVTMSIVIRSMLNAKQDKFLTSQTSNILGGTSLLYTNQ